MCTKEAKTQAQKTAIPNRVKCDCNIHQQMKNTHYLSPTFKCPCVMEANSPSWPDYKYREKQFWNINVARIYWGSVAPHLSLMASPSCCLPDSGPLKRTDLGRAVFALRARPCVDPSAWLCGVASRCQSVIPIWLCDWRTSLIYNVHLDFLSVYHELCPFWVAAQLWVCWMYVCILLLFIFSLCVCGFHQYLRHVQSIQQCRFIHVLQPDPPKTTVFVS